MMRSLDKCVCFSIALALAVGFALPALADPPPEELQQAAAVANSIGVVNDTATSFRCRVMLADNEFAQYQDVAPGATIGVEAGTGGYRAVRCEMQDATGARVEYCAQGAETVTPLNCAVITENTSWRVYIRDYYGVQVPAMVGALGGDIPPVAADAVTQTVTGPEDHVAVRNDADKIFRCRVHLASDETGTYQDVAVGASAELSAGSGGYKAVLCQAQDAEGALTQFCADGTETVSPGGCAVASGDASWRVYMKNYYGYMVPSLEKQ